MSLKKIIFIIICLCVFIRIFTSCSQEEYSDSLSCSELSNALSREISVPEGEFSQYTTEELKFFFPNQSIYTEAYIIYSADSTDIAELGILRASDEESAKTLYEEVKSYIKNLQEQKQEFLRNYAPNELQKLNSAQARRYGSYVIFTVSDSSEQKNVFEKADKLLSK